MLTIKHASNEKSMHGKEPRNVFGTNELKYHSTLKATERSHCTNVHIPLYILSTKLSWRLSHCTNKMINSQTANSHTVKPRYIATVRPSLNDSARRGWRLNEGSVNEPLKMSHDTCILLYYDLTVCGQTYILQHTLAC